MIAPKIGSAPLQTSLRSQPRARSFSSILPPSLPARKRSIGKPRHRTSNENWKQPLKWDREAAASGIRARVFCASLSDVFDREVDPAWRSDLWDLIRQCPHLDWQLLTKRPQLIASYLPSDWDSGWPNVWLGTSVENQRRAGERIPHLVAVPAVVHFLSVAIRVFDPFPLNLKKGRFER